jgi:hypothetical protein
MARETKAIPNETPSRLGSNPASWVVSGSRGTASLRVYSASGTGKTKLLVEHYALTAIWCSFVVAGAIVYMPMMYTRKTDKILKVLQQIEVNTRKS